MKAVVYERYGPPDVLELRDVATPRPGNREVLIGIHSTTVTSGDWRARSLQMPAGFGALGRSAANAELVRSLGASHVIDYTQADFTASGEKFDVIVDTVGTAPFSRSRTALTESGRLLLVLGGLADLLRAPWVAMTTRQRIIAGRASGSAEDLHTLAGLAEAGEFTPVIDRRYPIDQIVEAHRYVDSGRKRGNVIVTVRRSSTT